MNLRIGLIVPLVAVCAACAGNGASAPPATSAVDAAQATPTSAETASHAALVAALPNGTEAEPGVFTSGAPSQEDLVLAAEVGVKTVVDLRAEAEKTYDEQAEVEALGMRYVSVEVTGAPGLSRENVELVDAELAGDKPILVHCASGNRAGAMFALRAAWLQGADEEAAIEIGRAHGLTSLESAVREKIQAGE